MAIYVCGFELLAIMCRIVMGVAMDTLKVCRRFVDKVFSVEVVWLCMVIGTNYLCHR